MNKKEFKPEGIFLERSKESSGYVHCLAESGSAGQENISR